MSLAPTRESTIFRLHASSLHAQSKAPLLSRSANVVRPFKVALVGFRQGMGEAKASHYVLHLLQFVFELFLPQDQGQVAARPLQYTANRIGRSSQAIGYGVGKIHGY